MSITVEQGRLAEDLSIGKTMMVFTVETQRRDHLEEILSDLSLKGFDMRRKTEVKKISGKFA